MEKYLIPRRYLRNPPPSVSKQNNGHDPVYIFFSPHLFWPQIVKKNPNIRLFQLLFATNLNKKLPLLLAPVYVF
jgi:hypothetical protein